MTTVYSSNPPRNNDGGGSGGGPGPMGHQKYKRTYQPYIFQPNFLKQQVRQRQDAEKLHNTGSNYQDEHNVGLHSTGYGQQQHTGGNDDQTKRKSGRKVIDWTSSCVLYVMRRRWQRQNIDVPPLLPDPSYSLEMQSTMAYRHSPVSSVATKFVRSATNKQKCPVYKVVWTPDGRRLVTGSASGEFTLWNGTAFNFETILQAHDSPVRAMSWSRNDAWLITGDNQGYIKYWQLNMNNVKMYQAHKDQACRSVCFGPTDNKFATASDDGTVRVWDFHTCKEEHILRGHGADVKQVDWHPQKSLIASASKDLQTPVKLWDPKSGQSLCTLHAHKGTVMDIKWNRNGNWFLTASRDHLIKLYDIRNLKQERQVFRGHKKEAFTVAWHPVHEDMFASGGSEGSILFWEIGEDKDIGSLEGAHESLIWSLAWHPLGHILVSGSNDHSTKFWTRNRPGDAARDRTNIHGNDDGMMIGRSRDKLINSLLKQKEEIIFDYNNHMPNIPGMGDADAAAADVAKREEAKMSVGIPGLDWTHEDKHEFERKNLLQQQENIKKKIPFARPVPRSFQAAWESKGDHNNQRHQRYQRQQRSPSPLTKYAVECDTTLKENRNKSEEKRIPPPTREKSPPREHVVDHRVFEHPERRHDHPRGPPPPHPSRFEHRPQHVELPSLPQVQEPVRGSGVPVTSEHQVAVESYNAPPPVPTSVVPGNIQHRPVVRDEDMRQTKPTQQQFAIVGEPVEYHRPPPPEVPQPPTTNYQGFIQPPPQHTEHYPPHHPPQQWEEPHRFNPAEIPPTTAHYEQQAPPPPPFDVQQMPPYEGIPPHMQHYDDTMHQHHHQMMHHGQEMQQFADEQYHQNEMMAQQQIQHPDWPMHHEGFMHHQGGPQDHQQGGMDPRHFDEMQHPHVPQRGGMRGRGGRRGSRFRGGSSRGGRSRGRGQWR